MATGWGICSFNKGGIALSRSDFFQDKRKLNSISENGQFLANNPEKVFFVEEGKLLLFIVRLDEEDKPGLRKFIREISKGEVFAGQNILVSGNKREALLAVNGSEGAIVFSSDISNLKIDIDIVDNIENLSKEWDRELEEEKKRLEQKKINDKKNFIKSILGLAEEYEKEDTPLLFEDSDNIVLETCILIGNKINVAIKKPENIMQLSGFPLIEEIARVSKLRIRRVKLEGSWYKEDCGAVLGFLKENESPVALLPISPEKYLLVNLRTRRKEIITKEIADELYSVGYMFYKSFPSEKIKLKKLLSFSFQNVWKKDLIQLLLMGALGGALGTAIPIATGIVFDTIIPSSQKGELLQIAFFLFAVAISTMIFQYLRLIATLRLEGKIDGSLQAAVWDRLLSLPVPFFSKYSSGELAMRAMGVGQIRQILSGATLDAVLNGIFSVFYLLLLFYYDKVLAGYGTLLIIFTIIVSSNFAYRQIKYDRKAQELSNKLSGLLLQLIGGVSKFQVAGAESRAFERWAKDFKNQRDYNYKKENIANLLKTFNSFFPLLASMSVFYLLGKTQSTLPAGQFVAFNSAFTTLLISVVNMTEAFTGAGGIIPLYQRVVPILETLPEDDDTKISPLPLEGNIEVNHVSFRYKPEDEHVLKDISMEIKKGEYIALVGTSGSGKSTLLRVLLGFEQPESGKVYYDGQDMAKIDSRGVRKQLGVVLQNGELISGNILNNIIGTNPYLTIDDAWEAARIAGIDEDINEMPMGMHTMISEGTSTFSGGQKQRMMIARAVANKPKILYFDEATSALDNRTQAVVSKNLGELNVTRIIIAHRLSTILECDKIFVMDKGRIVEEGTFSQLMSKKGLFAELAKRQMA